MNIAKLVPRCQSDLTPKQSLVWLRGLLTIACADGHCDPSEQHLIEDLVDQKLPDDLSLETFELLTVEELTNALGQDARQAEDFIRTAVMVALVDGVFSATEDQILHQYCNALGLEIAALDALRLTLDGNHDPLHEAHAAVSSDIDHPHDLLDPMRHWLDDMEIHDPKIAHFLCKLIPPQCPFERDITLFGHKLVHVPPMCKLNPLYDQLVGLRFRALSYLADECQEDILRYV
jgi:tellurite resistance protein